MTELFSGLSMSGRGFRPIILLPAALAALIGCTSRLNSRLDRQIPPEPARQWVPPAEALLPARETTPPIPIPSQMLETRERWTLNEVVWLALANNPATRGSWAATRSAAANLGSRKGAYYPRLSGDFDWGITEGSAVGGQFTFGQKSYQPSFSLNYLLFSSGMRGADVDEARQRLYAANWTHNATVQSVVLQVEQAFYQYQYAKALRLARLAGVEEARANLKAAEQRRQAGLATVADVLQAQTNLSQAQLSLQSIEGDIQALRGALATAMGLPANAPYDIDTLPEILPVREVSAEVEELIRQAQVSRPDLAAARAQVLQAEAHTRSVKAYGRPSLSLRAGTGRIYYYNRDEINKTSNVGISAGISLFTGFSNQYNLMKAQADAGIAAERFEDLRQRVVLDVWTSYYDLKTAEQQLKTSADLLESATESQVVAAERYQTGVGSILELLSAQAALENARAQSLQAKTNWFLSLARVAYDTGSLWLTENKTAGSGARRSDKEGQE
ncbi:TolC family protein [candidate division KSB1 bacterium]